jgi:hypothetical protein
MGIERCLFYLKGKAMNKKFASLFFILIGINGFEKISIEPSKPIIGEVRLTMQQPFYKGREAMYLNSVFKLNVEPSDLIVEVSVTPEKLVKYFTHGKFYLPFKMFMEKKENDIIALSHWNVPIHLVCKMPDTHTEEWQSKFFLIKSLNDVYYLLMMSTFEHPDRFQTNDTRYLVKNEILQEVDGHTYFHGKEGYKSLVTHTPINLLPELSLVCCAYAEGQLDQIRKLVTSQSETSPNKIDETEHVKGIEELVIAVQNNVDCVKMIINKSKAHNLASHAKNSN